MSRKIIHRVIGLIVVCTLLAGCLAGCGINEKNSIPTSSNYRWDDTFRIEDVVFQFDEELVGKKVELAGAITLSTESDNKEVNVIAGQIVNTGNSIIDLTKLSATAQYSNYSDRSISDQVEVVVYVIDWSNLIRGDTGTRIILNPGEQGVIRIGGTVPAGYHLETVELTAEKGFAENKMDYIIRLTVGTDNYDSNGSVTNHIKWSLSDDGTLTISGAVGMEDYSYDNRPPWFGSRDNITSVIIQDGVTSIGAYAFADCDSLISVTIPDSVTSIGKMAFMDCGFTSVTIPNSVTSIDNGAFDGCKSLTSVTIPNSVTSIGGSAFSASGLVRVTIPDSVNSIGAWAFSYCSNLGHV